MLIHNDIWTYECKNELPYTYAHGVKLRKANLATEQAIKIGIDKAQIG